MNEILGFELPIQPLIYLVTNAIGAICFLYASYKNNLSKAELLLASSAVLSFACRLYYLLAISLKVSSLRVGTLGKLLLTTHAIAEFFAIPLFIAGAVLLAFGTKRPNGPKQKEFPPSPHHS